MSHPSSAARPKRAGEDFARSHENTSKKPRFDARNPSTLAPDAPEEDLILDADVIGKSGPRIKRNAVNIDGYESDSDNDNFDARAAERSRDQNGPAQSRDEEDEDMFADLEEKDGDDDDEDLQREGKKSQKNVRFLAADEIEGQVMNSKSGGHVSANLLLNPKDKRRQREGSVESSSSSGSDEQRDLLPAEMDEELAAEVGAGGKKKHAPKLDAFNLKDEEEEGKYDESGNYVRKATDPDAVNDNWLEGLSKKDMKMAKEAQDKRLDEQRRKAAQDDATLTSDVLSTLIQHLETGETPFEALARLNKGRPKETKVPKWKQKKLQKNRMDADTDAGAGNIANGIADPVEVARRNAVEAITGAADILYSREQHDIYEAERELLMRQYKRETGDDWQAPQQEASGNECGPDTMWEYRWIDARDGGQHHGPYDGHTMKAWNEAGFFSEGVEFRQAPSGEWSRVLDVT